MDDEFSIPSLRSQPNTISMAPSFFLFSFFLISSNLSPTSAQQQLTVPSFSSSDPPWRPNQNKTLTSNNSDFAAGFQLLTTSPALYVFSIWYHNISESTVVWTANTRSPVNQSASLSITAAGELRLSYSASGENLWPVISGNSNASELILRNDGNLVFGNWGSFDSPTDTFLQNQTMNGTGLVSQNRRYSFENSLNLVFNSSNIYWLASNTFQMLDALGKVILDNGGVIYSADFGESRLRRLKLDDDGNLRLYSFNPNGNQWSVVWQAVQELCTIFGTCGSNSICISDGTESIPTCICPPGFKNRTNSGDKNSCDRKIPLSDLENTKFLRLDYVNFTGGSNQTDLGVNLATCESKCSADPKCLGFGIKLNGKGYCVLQIERMLFGYWSPGTEATMYLRVDRSETDQSKFASMTDLLDTTCPVRISLPLPPEESKTTARNIAIICALFAAELISGGLFFWAFLKKYIKYRDMARTLGLEFLPAGGPKRFTYAEIKAATNDFTNAIGKGGFGDVYRGELPDHRVIAVKCLKNVAGGDTEFWAEVTIIARMHHLNLVRLWGFCAEKGQRILIYEYVPNGSLDKYLFRPGQVKYTGQSDNELETGLEQKPVLDWSVRYRIALGVARAIAYLHEECLEWVLHCDIKPENILLGDDFCPKISDFGLAKLRKKEDMMTMSRIRGTRGYMAPEWVKMDAITPKADVYSFGMVLLEIVSGVRNFEVQGSMIESEDWYFPQWAFDKVFKEMNVEDILDRQIKHCYDNRAHFDIINRMVKTAMWCLQDRPEMRPSMGKVAKMLEGTVEITEPKKPTIFFLGDE